MDLRLLRMFVAVARAGHYGTAAIELSISQPALTKQIQVLERRVGAMLFVRGRQGARLTTAGKALLPDALDLLDRADAFERRASSVAAGDDGSLAIGFGLSGIQLAPQAVALFRSRYPRVAVSLDDMSSAVQCERLLAGTLQIGFIRLPAPVGVDSLRLRRDRLSLALPSTVDPPRSVAAWLDGRPMIRLRPDRGPGLTGQIDRLYAELGCRPLVLQEAADLQTVLALVAAGVGAAVIPASADAIAPDAVRLIPLRGRAASWWIGAAWSERSLLVDRFLAAATEAART
ncbi:DNA-binding transcriptional LysR family regulator [Kribbella sp. VKM Ac-2527]|uniref:DNA-binding transcriptional LysR family regulator n=1 Tax=Kribbella caucasensis TaxID=2512215 RepID=A0A4R6JEK2_9ACTN|nr:LysR family transcriptional regulator [Kribbella sp. VKM Ac-2527]TDO34340.1 DNA-binding transcriptional LysR family regulator [Kribbella sp. VKM Ac-2527]